MDPFQKMFNGIDMLTQGVAELQRHSLGYQENPPGRIVPNADEPDEGDALREFENLLLAADHLAHRSTNKDIALKAAIINVIKAVRLLSEAMK